MKPMIRETWSVLICVLSFFGAILLGIYGLGISSGDSQFLHGKEPPKDVAATNIFIGAAFYAILFLFGLWQYYLNSKTPSRTEALRSSISLDYLKEQPNSHKAALGDLTDDKNLYPAFESSLKSDRN